MGIYNTKYVGYNMRIPNYDITKSFLDSMHKILKQYNGKMASEKQKKYFKENFINNLIWRDIKKEEMKKLPFINIEKEKNGYGFFVCKDIKRDNIGYIFYFKDLQVIEVFEIEGSVNIRVKKSIWKMK